MIHFGLTSYGFEHTRENFAALRASGLSAIEISGLGVPSRVVDFKKIGQYAKEYDILLWSCHLPFRPVDVMNIAIPDKEINKKCFAVLCETVDKAADLGVDKFVLHPSTPLPEGADREECKKYSMDIMYDIAEYAHKRGAVIAVEDMVTSCLGSSVQELAQMISINDKLRVCFDVNHLLNNTHEEFFELLHDKIVTTHISDYNFVQEQHLCPGLGKIDWPKLYSMFQKYNYDGAWIFEFGLDGAGSRLLGRRLTFDEIYKAAKDISEGKQPTYVV